MLRGRGAIHRHGSHAACAGAMGHEPGVERARLARGESEQQVEFALRESLRPVDALIGDHEVALVGGGLGKRPLCGQGVEKACNLGPRALPGRGPVVLEQHPARALLDAGRDEQRESPRREILPVRSAAPSRGEDARAHAVARPDAHGQERIHARLREARTLCLAHGDRRTQPRTQDRLLALGRRPDRPGLVGPSDHARGGAARAEDLDAAAQSVESLHARVVHDGAVAAEGPAPERIEGGARRGPGGRRIEQHQGLAVAAQARRDQQRREADIPLTRQWRNAQHVEARDPLQREQPGGGARRPDDVVVGERRPVVTVGIGERVPDRYTTGSAGGAIRALPRNLLRHAHQARLQQHFGHVARAIRQHRNPAVDLLVLDQLRARCAHPLYHQVEAVALGAVQAVIVHRGAQVLARAGIQRHEPQLRSSGGKGDGRRAGAVGDAHDERLAAAVLEELLDRVGDRRRLPQPAEVPLELAEAADGEHLVDRPLESAADEGGDSGGHALDGVTVAAFLYEFYAGRLANGHSGLSWHLPARL